MRLGNVLGEFSAKIMSLKQTDIGSGQRRVEIDFSGITITGMVCKWK